MLIFIDISFNQGWYKFFCFMILFSIIRNHNKKIISIFHVKQNLCFSIAIYKQSLNRFSSFYVRIFSFTLRVVNSENICTCICSKVVFLYHSNNCEWKCMHVQIRDKCLMLLSWCLMEWALSLLNVHFHRISFVPTLNLFIWLSLFN